MLSNIFRASRKRDVLVEGFFGAVRSEKNPRNIVESFSPILAAMASAPKDKYLVDAFQSGFSVLHETLSQRDFAIVALHVMGKTNQAGFNSKQARDIAFSHIQNHFSAALTSSAKQGQDTHVVGLIFAARCVVLSSLGAGHISEARQIVSDLQNAIEAFRRDDVTTPILTIQQTLREISLTAGARHELSIG